MKIVLQTKKECAICKSQQNLHRHHIFYGSAKRKQSEKYGLTVWLCAGHHNMSNESVHFNKQLDAKLKQYAQRKFEEKYSREEFIEVFGRSYL